jgi:predicted protein tyrosine phosphatase
MNRLQTLDEEILTIIFEDRIQQDDNVTNRQDVHAKKILRSAKEYYEQILEAKLMYKQKRQKVSRSKVRTDPKCFLDYIDKLVANIFGDA